jgi:hypothetical protein
MTEEREEGRKGDLLPRLLSHSGTARLCVFGESRRNQRRCSGDGRLGGRDFKVMAGPRIPCS